VSDISRSLGVTPAVLGLEMRQWLTDAEYVYVFDGGLDPQGDALVKTSLQGVALSSEPKGSGLTLTCAAPGFRRLDTAQYGIRTVTRFVWATR
jgi:hypothetical protein